MSLHYETLPCTDGVLVVYATPGTTRNVTAVCECRTQAQADIEANKLNRAQQHADLALDCVRGLRRFHGLEVVSG